MMNRKFLWLLILSCSIACQTTSSNSNISMNVSPIKTSQTPEKLKETVESQKNIPKVKWIFLEEPLEFDEKHSFAIGSNAIIFYENGVVATAGINLYEKKNSKPEVTASFDEVVLLGKWKEQKNEIKLTFENCRCQHCGEDHGEKMSKKQMSNPIPFSQSWKLETNKSDETSEILVRSDRRYRLVNQSDFVFTNYNDMVSEPLTIKNTESDEKCIAFDVEGL
jgi:hypothetical protein